MGEAAKVAAGHGGAASRDGGARDTRAVRRRGRAAGPAAQHTAARRRVRPGRALTVTSPLSASRADEKQLPASPEQVRERRARVGGRRRGGAGAAWRRQEGRPAAEGHALVGAHGRARAGAGAAALRHGAAARRRAAARGAARLTRGAARLTRGAARLTRGAARLTRRPRRAMTISRLHSISGTVGEPPAGASRTTIDLLFIYSGAPTALPRRPPREPVFLAPSKSFAKTKTEIK